MEKMVRFGMSMEEELLVKLSAYMKRKGYTNRSEALRDFVREKLIQEDWEGGEAEAIGTVSIVYDHESHELSHKLTHLQHEKIGHVVAALHVHVDQHHCLEALVLRGRGREVKKLADGLISTKGVKHGKAAFVTIDSIS
jgi:CopG family transcriptional regulator, nickel-responsive regulator